MERRFTQQARAIARVEKRSDGTPVIVGYASVFYNASDPGTEYELWPAMGTYPRTVERILPGAFDGVLGSDVRGLFNHDANQLLGRTSAKTMSLSVDAVGLRYEIVPADTSSAKDVLELIRRGDLTGSSFSFGVGEQRWVQGQNIEIREIVKVDPLYDVGPVTFPAYEASTTGLRATGSIEEAAEACAAWRKKRSEVYGQQIQDRLRAIEVASGL